MSRKKKQISKIHPDFQDEFFIKLDRILLPLGGYAFEKAAMDVAFYIAHEYGIKIDILHIGKDTHKIPDSFFKKLNKFRINHDLIIRKNQLIAQSIIDQWEQYRYDLVIMAARRRPSFFDKITLPSVSDTVVKNIQAEILQVFPSKLKKLSQEMKNIVVLLPYKKRDPFLLRWGAAIAAPQRGATINVYHISLLPETVPIAEARNEEEIIRETEEFQEYVNQYANVFGHFLKSKFILGHDGFQSLRYIAESEEPDVVIIGKTKQKSFWSKFKKSLSSKIRDRLLEPTVIIHHMR